jgi:formylglycine-generating enzyme required for sulfatase activity
MKLFRSVGVCILSVSLVLIFTGCPSGTTNPSETDYAAANRVNSNLRTLTISSGTLTPAFSASVTAYSVDVSEFITTMTVTGTTETSLSTISANNGVAQSLAIGTNAITLTVTTASGTTKNYVVMVNRSSFGLTMIPVPAGSFQRDATLANISTVSAFKISEKEITRRQYLAIMDKDPAYATYSSGMDDPVQMVNKYQAIAFCNKLSLKYGLTPVYAVSGVDFTTLNFDDIPNLLSSTAWTNATANWSANGYRLPTHMEWMWAAMGAPADGQGGTTNTTGYAKPFAGSTGSNAIGDYAVFGYSFSETGRTLFNRTSPVGSKLPNEIGLYDMSGNVNEWIWDWYEAIPSGTLSNYRGGSPSVNAMRINGGWEYQAYRCALTYTLTYAPNGAGNSGGFRVAQN